MPRPLQEMNTPTRQAGYTQTVVATEATRLAYNAWVRTAPSVFDGTLDPASYVEDAATGKWSASTLVSSGTLTSGSPIRDSSANWGTGDTGGVAGYVFRNTTTGASFAISHAVSSTELALVVSSTAPSTGNTYEIRQGPTADGLHPTGYGHGLMATASIDLLTTLGSA